LFAPLTCRLPFVTPAEFSSSAKTLQDELKETEVEASVRDGAVTIVMTGQQHPVSVTVSDDIAKLGGEEVSKAVTECLVAAHSKRCVSPCPAAVRVSPRLWRMCLSTPPPLTIVTTSRILAAWRTCKRR
jgi:hypothetical protein